jgi:hypothetical protein
VPQFEADGDTQHPSDNSNTGLLKTVIQFELELLKSVESQGATGLVWHFLCEIIETKKCPNFYLTVDYRSVTLIATASIFLVVWIEIRKLTIFPVCRRRTVLRSRMVQHQNCEYLNQEIE